MTMHQPGELQHYSPGEITAFKPLSQEHDGCSQSWMNPTAPPLLPVAATLTLSCTEPFEGSSGAGLGCWMDPPSPWAASEGGPRYCSVEVFPHIHLQVVSSALTILSMFLVLFLPLFFSVKSRAGGGWECSPQSHSICPLSVPKRLLV